ncbi:DEAD/DEAH box helicase [Rothia aerolata]|uniref:DNA helicase n=1 Tax=Rothia aerolata TaxID=1812262 RepID=A0A917ITU9_9MICC|nr:DEAD/DEAH box helicase [Rothia aerolata]GGH62547.1 DNA helicase [Rothia aerolata]
MAESSAFPAIPVTAAEIIRQVGHGAYSRGQKYMRAGQVVRYSFDQSTRTLSGEVTGSAASPYRTRVTFPAEKTSGSLAFSARCTCPVYVDCKHAVALMLTAIDRSDKARKALTAQSDTWRSSTDFSEPRMGEAMASKLSSAEGMSEDFKKKLEQLGVTPASALEKTESKMPAWRRELSRSINARPLNAPLTSQRVSGALDLKIYVPSQYAIGHSSGRLPQATLQARPMMLGARGKWIKGGLSWETFQRDLSRGGNFGFQIYPEHEKWFAEFYSIVRPWQSAYGSHRDWVSISDVSSSLFWQVLKKAQEIDLPLLINGSDARVFIADPSSVQLRVEDLAEAGRTDCHGLSLTPVLTWGNTYLPTVNCHKIGNPRTGFFALGASAQDHYEHQAEANRWAATRASALETAGVELPQEQDDAAAGQTEAGRVVKPDWLTPETDLVLIPLAEPLTPMAESLAVSESIDIPSSDVESFYRDFYPQLARALPLKAASAELELPQVREPELVLTVTFETDQPHTARTAWVWEYPQDPLAEDSPITVLPALGYPGEDREDIRDTKYEYRVLKEVKAIRPAVPFAKHKYQGWQTRTLLEETLPRYREIAGVRVDFEGPVPEFREIEEKPEITVTVDSTRSRDWFGLGIAIKAGEWYVPFAKIFEALNAGQTHLLLGDGSYFALDRPEFMKLQELLREAAQLKDRDDGELLISRHQAGLWEELEELAASVDAVEAWKNQVSALIDIENGPLPEPPASLRAQLRPYQLEGFQWLSFLWEHSLGGILADDMGLGKTVQTIATIARARELSASPPAPRPPEADSETDPAPSLTQAPFLVVAPTSVVPNWQREFARFAPHLKVVTLFESQKKSKTLIKDAVEGADVVITSYALFRIDEAAYFDLGVAEEWNGLILDEAQFVKNAKTKAHRLARDLPARFKLAVTGTPMENNLMELWAMFSIVAPGLFPSARAFKDFYATPIEGGEDKQALPRLRQRVRPLMKRRTKDLVAADLPEKSDLRVDVPLEPAHRRAYDTVLQRERKKVLGLLEDMDRNRFTVFQSLTMLRRMALDASLIDADSYGSVPSSKLDYLEENLPEIVEDGHRALIFSQFTSYLKKVAERLDALGIPYLYLDGATGDRARVLERFEAGEAPLFLISLKAGGFGLNLTSADYCFIMDPWWNPAAEQQAVDRVHRIGQTRHVMVYRLVSAGTIEEKVMELKESKAALFDAVVDEGQFFSSSLTAEQVRDLLTSSEE